MEQRPLAMITGATSGIGLAFAETYAHLGYDLLLTGRRRVQLEQAAEHIRQQYQVNCTLRLLELSDPAARKDLTTEMAQHPIEVLINNAGFGCNGFFYQGPMEEYQRMVEVHISCVLQLTRAALDQMVPRDHGTIINVASDAAYVIVPHNAVYAGTKAFVKQFTEGVALDLCSCDSHVQVQALCPGLTKTDFQLKMGMAKEKQRNHGMMRWQEPQEVVDTSLHALKKNQTVCLCGGLMGRMEACMAQLPKPLYDRIILQLFPAPTTTISQKQ